MAREGVDIFHNHCLSACRRCAAHTFAKGNAQTAQRALVRANDKLIKERSTDITLRATAKDNPKLTDSEEARFIAPADWFN